MTPKLNPFHFGNPVQPDQFTGRISTLRRLVNRILTGQSSAIVGDPRCGKTSIFEYLHAPSQRLNLYGEQADKVIFFYMDSMSLGQSFSQAEFWKHAIQPLHSSLIQTAEENTPIAMAYKLCAANDFGSNVLERFFHQVRTGGFRLVLLLDEFDTLLHHPILNSAEFFGGLRSVVSRGKGAVCMVMASRQPLGTLNRETQEFNRTGSPYFNFLDEYVLSPLTLKASKQLLEQAGNTFNSLDRNFILKISGGHPYLLQAAGAKLWEGLEETPDDHGSARQYAQEEVFSKASDVIQDTWRIWSPETRKAFMAVALDHNALAATKHHRIDVSNLLGDLHDLSPELNNLKKQGYIVEDPESRSGWHVRTRAFLWWLNDELIRAVRNESAFNTWIQSQEWDALLKKGQRSQIKKAAHEISGLLKDGFFKGLGEGLAKRLSGV